MALHLILHRRHAAVAAAPVALSAVLLAGCGSSAAQTPYQLVSNTSAKTSATNAKIALTGSVAAGAQSFPINGAGAFDFAQHRGVINLTVPQAGTIESRIIGSTIYEKLPPQLTSQTGGKQWLKIDLDALSKSMGGNGQLGSLSQSGDPTQVLKYLRGSSDAVKTVGPETVRGVKTTHYTAQADLQKAVQQGAFGQSTVDTFKKQFGTTTFPVDVWIDKQGRADRTSYSLKPLSGVGSFTFTQEMYDFGKADVGALTPPPADQTQDVSELAKKAAGTAGG